MAVRAKAGFRSESALEIGKDSLVTGHSRQSKDHIAQILG